LRAQRGDGGVDDGIVDHAAQILLHGDGLLELLSIAHQYITSRCESTSKMIARGMKIRIALATV